MNGKKENIAITIKPELRKKLQQVKEEIGIPVSIQIEKAIERGLK